MSEILADPLLMGLIVGPIAGVVWSKILKIKHNHKKQTKADNDNIVIKNIENISASDHSQVQIGQGNRVSNTTINNHSPNQNASKDNGELFLFGFVGLLTAVSYIRYSSWAFGLSLLSVIFAVTYTLCSTENYIVKSIKSVGYVVLFLLLYQTYLSPIDPYYVNIVQQLKGQGLVAYINAVKDDFLPFSILTAAMGQAGALLFITFISHGIRVARVSGDVFDNMKRIGAFSLCMLAPLYLMNIEQANEYLAGVVGIVIGGIV